MCIYSSHFFSIPFSYDRHLGYFHILATVNNAVIKVVVQISLQEIDFISFRCIPTSPSCSPCTPAQSSITISFSSVQLLSHVRLFATPWTAARQASLSITNSRSSPKLMSIESVMPSNHLILFHPLLLLPSVFLSIMVFSNESTLCIRWPKYWSFSFNISPSNDHFINTLYISYPLSYYI